MKLTIAIIVIGITIILSGCSKHNDCSDGKCEKTVLVNAELYNNTITNNYQITDAVIEGDCLKIKFGASGCDSKTWIVELVDV